MNLYPKAIEEYCEKHSTSPSTLLQKVKRETYLRTLKPNMISGHILGSFYHELMLMFKPKRVLEIGTFTGYSTLCIASALAKDSQITTIEINEESHWLANEFFKESEFESKINSILGDALTVIKDLDSEWDFVLIDAAKKDNLSYYELLLDRMAPGGYIAVDNVIWSGKVTSELIDKKAEGIDQFNKTIHNDSRVSCLMLPLRDGLTLIRKK